MKRPSMVTKIVHGLVRGKVIALEQDPDRISILEYAQKGTKQTKDPMY
jgi:hypothetical protein